MTLLLLLLVTVTTMSTTQVFVGRVGGNDGQIASSMNKD